MLSIRTKKSDTHLGANVQSLSSSSSLRAFRSVFSFFREDSLYRDFTGVGSLLPEGFTAGENVQDFWNSSCSYARRIRKLLLLPYFSIFSFQDLGCECCFSFQVLSRGCPAGFKFLIQSFAARVRDTTRTAVHAAETSLMHGGFCFCRSQRCNSEGERVQESCHTVCLKTGASTRLS